MARTLILYYSKSGQNYAPNKSVVLLEKGYTQQVAEALARKVEGADLFRIETMKELPDDLKKFSARELLHGALHLYPKTNALPGIDRYEVIYLCYPVYMGTLPTPVRSFLKRCEIPSTAEVVSISTSFQTGFGKSLAKIEKILGRTKLKRGPAFLAKDLERIDALLEGFLKEERGQGGRPG